MRISVVGMGNLGSNLSLYLRKKKLLFGILARDRKKRDYYLKTLKLQNKSKREILLFSDLIFLTVKDSFIKKIAEELSFQTNRKNGKIVHTSGTQPVSLLDFFKKKGWSTGSFHPVQTFTRDSDNCFKGIYATYVGDREILPILKKVFSRDVKILITTENEKKLVHLASVFSSNFLCLLNIISEKILKEIKDEIIDLRVLFPLIETTLKNIKRKGAKKALTGPALRRDFDTIKKHKKILKEKFPEFLEIYKILTKCIIGL